MKGINDRLAKTGIELALRETPQSVSVITRQRMDDQELEFRALNLKHPKLWSLYVWRANSCVKSGPILRILL